MAFVNITGTDSQNAALASNCARRAPPNRNRRPRRPHRAAASLLTQPDKTHAHGPGPSPGLVSRLFTAVYGVYALSLLAVLMGVAAVLAFVLPKLAWRRGSTRALARFW